jgi:hypothetical protein
MFGCTSPGRQLRQRLVADQRLKGYLGLEFSREIPSCAHDSLSFQLRSESNLTRGPIFGDHLFVGGFFALLGTTLM